MAEADFVALNFGSVYRKNGFWGLTGDKVREFTGSLWNFTYKLGTPQETFSGSNEPILGPDCMFTPAAYGCYAAPTGPGGPEGKSAYDYITLKPGMDTMLYLDVGFWGGDSRTFGLVCGPHAWLCKFGAVSGAPPGTDQCVESLVEFQKAVGCFSVVTYGNIKLHDDDFSGLSTRIFLILPDMHMWPDPERLSQSRGDYMSAEEWDEVNASLASGKLVKKSDGSFDVPDQPADSRPETGPDRAVRLYATPGGKPAMKYNQLRDVIKMKKEEHDHAFGSAGKDLITLLNAVGRARKQFDVSVWHIGDLFEMWAPVETCIDGVPFAKARAAAGQSSPDWLRLSKQAIDRIPKWLKLIYRNPNNTATLDAMERLGCRNVYGNHDVFLALGEWGSTGIPFIDAMKGSRAWWLENLLWLEHGHRFQFNNKDGYWSWDIVNKPPGPLITGLVNYYPGLRALTDRFDNREENLYGKNLPYASLWYLLAHHAQLKEDPRTKLFARPPKFRIFCQGHTHSPVLLKVHLTWKRMSGSPPWVTEQAQAAGAGR